MEEKGFDGRFYSGDPRCGRKKGALAEKTKQVQEFVYRLWADQKYLRSVRNRLMSGKAPHLELFFAQHRFGKPKERLEISALDITKLELIIVDSREDNGNGNENGHGYQLEDNGAIVVEEVSSGLDDSSPPERGVPE